MSDHAAPCERCPLQPPYAVASRGPVPARLLLLSGAPRYHEEHEGTAFASPAFAEMEAMLTAAGLDAMSVHYATLTGCRPPHQRPIRQDEIAACGPRLDQTVAAVAPEVVVLCGPDAVAAMLPGVALETGHGRLVVRGRRRYYPIRHPYAALHYQPYIDEVMADLRHLAELLAAGRLDSEAAVAGPAAAVSRAPAVLDEVVPVAADEQDEIVAVAADTELFAMSMPEEMEASTAAREEDEQTAVEADAAELASADGDTPLSDDETSATISAASEQEPAAAPLAPARAAADMIAPYGGEDEAPAQLSLF